MTGKDLLPHHPPYFLVRKNVILLNKLMMILYYSIDMERTNFHELYGEAIKKTYLPPVRIYALVEFTDYATDYMEGVGIDKTWDISVHFHKRRLSDDQNVEVREGDFVLYGDFYYEIVKLSEPRKLFGQVAHSFEVTATCKRSRKGLFDATW